MIIIDRSCIWNPNSVYNMALESYFIAIFFFIYFAIPYQLLCLSKLFILIMFCRLISINLMIFHSFCSRQKQNKSPIVEKKFSLTRQWEEWTREGHYRLRKKNTKNKLLPPPPEKKTCGNCSNNGRFRTGAQTCRFRYWSDIIQVQLKKQYFSNNPWSVYILKISLWWLVPLLVLIFNQVLLKENVSVNRSLIGTWISEITNAQAFTI